MVSALMAVGIPLDPQMPCSTINPDKGRSYGRWHLLPLSADGKHETHKLNRAWSGYEALPANHPFSWLMEFIREGRSNQCRTVEDWLGFAHDHCRDLGIPSFGLPARLEQIPDLCKKLPEARQSYIFAFVHCRDLAWMIYQQERRVQVLQQRGRASSLIDVKLPQWQRNELLSRLDG